MLSGPTTMNALYPSFEVEGALLCPVKTFDSSTEAYCFVAIIGVFCLSAFSIILCCCYLGYKCMLWCLCVGLIWLPAVACAVLTCKGRTESKDNKTIAAIVSHRVKNGEYRPRPRTFLRAVCSDWKLSSAVINYQLFLRAVCPEWKLSLAIINYRLRRE